LQGQTTPYGTAELAVSEVVVLAIRSDARSTPAAHISKSLNCMGIWLAAPTHHVSSKVGTEMELLEKVYSNKGI